MAARRKIALVVVALVTAGAGLVYAALVSLSPLPLRVLDRDSSGVVSLAEALDSHDVGSRPSELEPSCTELYWLKDGAVAYVSCTGASRGP